MPFSIGKFTVSMLFIAEFALPRAQLTSIDFFGKSESEKKSSPAINNFNFREASRALLLVVKVN